MNVKILLPFTRPYLIEEGALFHLIEIARIYHFLINMKAMDSVTSVVKMRDRGGEQLWKTSHWMLIRGTPGHE